MYAWQAIQKTVDYIEDRLEQKFSVEDLAKIAALSPFYFQRLFARLVNKPVMEYIRLRRLARASGALLEKDRLILDVALEYGYSGNEGFTRAFKEAYGITPEQYRADPKWLAHFAKPELSMQYTMIDEGMPLVAGDIVLEINRKTLAEPWVFFGRSVQAPAALIPMGEVTGVDVLGDFWQMFHSVKRTISGTVVGGCEIGASLPGKQEGYFTYYAGVQALPGADEPEGCERFALAAGEYIVCRFEAETSQELVTSALDKALKYLYNTWLKNHGITTEMFSAEIYKKTAMESNEIEVWVKPVAQ